jgi:GNAT superfamily N-acetyltransferase
MKLKICLVLTFLIICQSLFAVNKTCAELMSMIKNKLDVTSTIRLADGQEVRIRAAKLSDVTAVTALTHRAFDIWKAQGLKLSPMFQTDEKTTSYLIDKGFVVENYAGAIIATFSFENGSISVAANNEVNFTEGNSPAALFEGIGNNQYYNNQPFLIFKKLAVSPDYSKLGLGNQLYQISESIGRANGYSGIILETVKDANWLYEWYVRLGFSPIGSHKYTGSQVETILMAKPFNKESGA